MLSDAVRRILPPGSCMPNWPMERLPSCPNPVGSQTLPLPSRHLFICREAQRHRGRSKPVLTERAQNDVPVLDLALLQLDATHGPPQVGLDQHQLTQPLVAA